MIRGTVSRRRAYAQLTVRGLGGQGDVEFAVDTGFTGMTTLPPTACTSLTLTFLRRQPSFVANRGRIVVDVYELTLLWDDTDRVIEVLALEGTPLLGMALLEGHEVRIQAADGGQVTIEPL
jgi:clan AA aspartic protease